MKKQKVILIFGFLLILVFWVFLYAISSESFVLQLDPKVNCILITGRPHNWRPAVHRISPGRWRVTLKTNIHYHYNRIPVRKVIIYNTTDDQPFGWFYIVEEGKPITIKVSGKGVNANFVYAVLLDVLINDNTGKATLYFEKIGFLPYLKKKLKIR